MTTEIIRHESTSKRRILLASTAISFGDLIVLLCGIGENNLHKGMIAVLELVFCTFYLFGKKKALLKLLVLLFVNALIAGVLMALPKENAALSCMTMGVVVLLFRYTRRSIKNKQLEEGYVYPTVLCYGAERKEFVGYLDSGNRLHKTGSRMPVLICGKGAIKDWMEDARTVHPENFIFVPFSTVGEEGVLYGVRVNCTIVLKNQSLPEQEVAVVESKRYVFKDREYNLLLQPEVLEYTAVE